MGRKAKGRAKGRDDRQRLARQGNGSATKGRRRDERPPGRRTADPVVLAERLAGVATLLTRRLDRSGSEAGLSEARRAALALLALGGPRTLGSLATAEGVRPPTMTRMVSAMEARGLVERTASATDGRAVIVRATEAGEELLARAGRPRLAPIAASLGGLGSREQATIEDALDILERTLRDG